MYFNRFDICEAYYMYATLYHGGQWSEEYRIFTRLHHIGFKPAPSLTSPDKLEENARAIYDNLVACREKEEKVGDCEECGYPADECIDCGCCHQSKER